MKKSVIVKYFILALIGCCSIFFLRKNILSKVNVIFKPRIYNIQELSILEKIEDFNKIYDTITLENPSIKGYKTLYGDSLLQNKKHYIDIVKRTKNNYEFYAFVDSFLQQIPSFHTELVSPNIDSYNELSSFGSLDIMSNRSILGASKYWEKTKNEESKKYLDSYFYPFDYYNGKYIFKCELDEANIKPNSQLLLIDDVDISNFVIENLMIYNLYYDHINKKPCRTKIVFNSKYGKPVTLTLSDDKHNTYQIKLRYDIYEEESYFLNIEKDYKSTDFKQKSFKDIQYIRFDYFDEESGIKFKKLVKNNKCKNIVIDLRENSGGFPSTINDYFYSSLSTNDYTLKTEWCMPLTANNKKAYDEIINKIIYKFYKKETKNKFVFSKEKKTYNGLRKQSLKNCIILTSHSTGSSADLFVNIMKNSENNVTVVGENSAGEGMMGTFMTSHCKNSKLVYIYMPSKNTGFINNSVYGTSPDIYCDFSSFEPEKILSNEEILRIYKMVNK